MTGVLLLSADSRYEDANGSVTWGPKSDKLWLQAFIENKVVFIGHNTWRSIKSMLKLAELPKQWIIGIPNEQCEIHFGGPKSLIKYPPDELIVHYANVVLSEGPSFEIPEYYTETVRRTFEDYTEVVYVKK